jgi:hypothetical protein
MSFEDLLGLLPPANRTSELFESLENLTEQQEGMLQSFMGKINATSLSQDEFISLLNSTEDLLDKQYNIKEGFMDLLNESKPYLGVDFTVLMSSVEDLLVSDAELLSTFECQLHYLFSLSTVTVCEKIYFLESYECLLEEQSQLLQKFEEMMPPTRPPSDPPDIACLYVASSKSVVGQGFSASVTATVANLGTNTDTFNVTLYANSTAIGTQAVTLAGGNSTTITFTWNTTGFAYGNYAIWAYTWPAPGEINTAENTFKAPAPIEITIPGDVGGYHVVNILDVVMITSIYGMKQGNPKFNPNCDIENIGQITILDVVACTSHYAQKYP